MKTATKAKVYHSFTDRFGNEYKFEDYMSFARFWFNMKRRTAIEYFPHNHSVLQNYAYNSREARTKVY